MRLIPFLLLTAAWVFQPAPLHPQERMNPEEFKKRMAEREGKLQAGDPAPDFRLKRRGSDEFVQLSSFRGQKPVLLYFGSFT